MAIAFRALGTAVGGPNITSIAGLTVPAGTQDGDALVLSYYNSGGGTPTCTGFTMLANKGGCWVFGRVAASESGAYTLQCNATVDAAAVIAGYSGVAASPFGATATGEETSSVNNHILPSLTVSDYTSMVLGFVKAINAVGSGFTPPSGWTERLDSAVGSGIFTLCFFADKVFGPGATGTATAVEANPGAGQDVTLELMPAPVTGTIVSASSLTATLLKGGELGGAIRSDASALTVAQLSVAYNSLTGTVDSN